MFQLASSVSKRYHHLVSTTTIDYFLNLKSFHDFSQVGQSSIYQDWPTGWSLILTDIRGSTKAIQEGRYKEVNLIGAASIAAYVKCAGTQEVPFVFGGDGATLLVPNSMRSDLIEELKSLQNLAAVQFSLDLRVGYLDVDDLKSMGHPLKVAKYELSPGNFLAQFAGGAVSLAESLVKSNDSRATVLSTATNQTSRDITGISCRLQPLRSSHGKILTLLCKPIDEKKSIETVHHVVKKLNIILESDLQSATPVKHNQMHWPVLPTTSPLEVALMGKSASIGKWIGQVLFALLSNLSLRFEFNMGGFNPKKYKKELQLNSDFKKFDETLRMVLDCTNEQIEKIHSLFQELHKEKLVNFGMHISNEALMTCMVQSPTLNRHIHFIDGADGGYAMAAIELKKQLTKNNIIN